MVARTNFLIGSSCQGSHMRLLWRSTGWKGKGRAFLAYLICSLAGKMACSCCTFLSAALPMEHRCKGFGFMIKGTDFSRMFSLSALNEKSRTAAIVLRESSWSCGFSSASSSLIPIYCFWLPACPDTSSFSIRSGKRSFAETGCLGLMIMGDQNPAYLTKC